MTGQIRLHFHWIVWPALLCSFAGRLFASETVGSRESIEWCDLWLTHANETNRPRVLLIGDSITRGCAPVVDLYSPMLGHPDYHTDNVHFNPTGIAIQAEVVAEKISTLLGLPNH